MVYMGKTMITKINGNLWIDLDKITFVSQSQEDLERYFINISNTVLEIGLDAYKGLNEKLEIFIGQIE